MTTFTVVSIDDNLDNADEYGHPAVTLHVDFATLTPSEVAKNPDDAPAGVYVKRMHADCSSPAALVNDVLGWLADYEPGRVVEPVPAGVTAIIDEPQTVDVEAELTKRADEAAAAVIEVEAERLEADRVG